MWSERCWDPSSHPCQGCGLGHSGSGLSQFMDQQGPLWVRGDLVEWSEEPQPPAAGAGTLSPRAGRGPRPTMPCTDRTGTWVQGPGGGRRGRLPRSDVQRGQGARGAAVRAVPSLSGRSPEFFLLRLTRRVVLTNQTPGVRRGRPCFCCGRSAHKQLTSCLHPFEYLAHCEV